MYIIHYIFGVRLKNQLWKIGLITSSLLPLHTLMLIRITANINWTSSNVINLISENMPESILFITNAVLFLGGAVFLISFSLLNRSFANSTPYRVESSEEDSDVNFDFFITLIIPLVMVDVSSIPIVLMYCFALMMIYALMYRSRKYYANPVLFIFGYKVYRVKLHNQDHICHILSRQCLLEDDLITIFKIDTNLYYSYKQGD